MNNNDSTLANNVQAQVAMIRHPMQHAGEVVGTDRAALPFKAPCGVEMGAEAAPSSGCRPMNPKKEITVTLTSGHKIEICGTIRGLEKRDGLGIDGFVIMDSNSTQALPWRTVASVVIKDA